MEATYEVVLVLVTGTALAIAAVLTSVLANQSVMFLVGL
jgi:hypothetical protein